MQQALPIWTRVTWRYPQWWFFSASLLAWLAIGVHTYSAGTGLDAAHHHHHNGAAMMMSWTSETYCWMLMVVAMMLPLIADSARNVAARSLWSRRQRAIAVFVLGYLSIWLMAGVVLSLLLTALGSQVWFDPRWAMTLSFLITIGWQTVPIKRRALISCHRTRPIAPEGLQADWDCMRYGGMIGGSCLLNCWAWMLFCTLTGHHPGAMAFAMFIGIAERYPIRKVSRIALTPSSLLALLR
jgi:hypothetical protein